MPEETTPPVEETPPAETQPELPEDATPVDVMAAVEPSSGPQCAVNPATPGTDADYQVLVAGLAPFQAVNVTVTEASGLQAWFLTAGDDGSASVNAHTHGDGPATMNVHEVPSGTVLATLDFTVGAV